MCYMETQLPFPKGAQAPNFRPMSIVARRSVAHLSYCWALVVHFSFVILAAANAIILVVMVVVVVLLVKFVLLMHTVFFFSLLKTEKKIQWQKIWIQVYWAVGINFDHMKVPEMKNTVKLTVICKCIPIIFILSADLLVCFSVQVLGS